MRIRPTMTNSAAEFSAERYSPTAPGLSFAGPQPLANSKLQVATNDDTQEASRIVVDIQYHLRSTIFSQRVVDVAQLNVRNR